MLVLIAPAERYVARHRGAVAGSDAVDWSLTERLARRVGPRADVLSFGTSMTSYAFVPAVFQRVTGLRAFNLALGYGPPPAAYALFRRALRSGARPSAVLLEFHPDSLRRPPRFGARIWAEVLSPGELLGLALAARDPGLFASVALAEALPSLRDRDRIRAALTGALRGEDDPTPDLNRMIARNKRVNAGALIQPVKGFKGEVAASHREVLLDPSWGPSAVGREYVRRFLDLARARGVRVFWLIPPFCPKLRDGRAAAGLDRAFASFLRGLQGQFPDLTVIDGLDAGYGDDVFVDATHLNRRGALALTEAVGSLVAAGRQTPRWVRLPAYRPVPDGTVEDLVQSFALVRSAGAEAGTARR
jgi:hypothetical protein